MDKKVIIGIAAGILIILGVVGYQFLKPGPQPQFVEGEEILNVIILGPDNNPVQNLEVDLWTAENPQGPPTAGYSMTDNNGEALFKVLEGEYLIGFNGNNFPGEFINPGKTHVNVKKGENEETIILELN